MRDLGIGGSGGWGEQGLFCALIFERGLKLVGLGLRKISVLSSVDLEFDVRVSSFSL